MGLSLAEKLAELQPAARRKLLTGLSDQQIEDLLYDWGFWARPEQLLPSGDWDIWLILTGRGWGKTRAGAEAVRRWESEGVRRLVGVGRTAADVRDVMIEGESGLLSLYPDRDRPLYEPSKTRVTWRTGAVMQLFSADKPDQLRGPQGEKAWIDEPATWKRGQEAYDNMMFGLRLGLRPQVVATSTPRPVKLIRTLTEDPGTLVQTGSLLDNVDNLAPSFARRIIDRYQGTRLGRQEIDGILLKDTPGALWKRPWIDDHRWGWDEWEAATARRIVVAVDPSTTDSEESDEAGIVAAAEVGGGEFAVIEDRSRQMAPTAWANTAIDLYIELRADMIVFEQNQGGDMVLEMLRNAAQARDIPMPSYRGIHAKRGKVLRAQPVAGLYQQQRVHHVGVLAELEDQQCNFDPLNMPDNDDRVDAVVYALIELSGVEPLEGQLMA